MKQFFLLALAAATMFSCSKQNEEPQDTSVVPGLELTITGASKAPGRADGDKVTGIGDENRIVNFGAFVKEIIRDADNNIVGGANGKVFVFREITDYITDAGKKLSFGEVGVGSDVYVITNYKPDPALVATTGIGATAVVGTLYTDAQVKALFQKIQKGDLNSFSTALQTDPSNPVFATPATNLNSMLMAGTAKVPTSPMDVAPDDKKIKVEVVVERQFIKINAGMPIVGDNFKDNNDTIVIDKANLHPQNEETIYFLRRTAQTLYYFDYAKSLMALPFIKDVVPGDIAALGSNTALNEPTATEYRYAYERKTEAQKANFYSTRNEAVVDKGATSVIYRIGYKCDINIPAGTINEKQVADIPANTLFYRYYKTYVTKEYDAQWKPSNWSTGVGLYYQFDNTLVGWGYDSEDEAVDGGETVDINVRVKIADWTVKTAQVPME